MTESGFNLSSAQAQALGTPHATDVRRLQLVAEVDGAGPASTIVVRFAQACARYDVLRTAFVRPVGLSQRLQAVRQDENVAQLLDGAAVEDVRAAEMGVPLDAGHGGLVRLAVTGTHLVLTAAAAIADERSLRLLGAQLLNGTPAEEDPLQFVDYAAWEGEQLAGEGADARIAKAYWSGMLGTGTTAAMELPLLDVRAVPVADLAFATAEDWLAAWALVLQRHGGPEPGSVVLAVAADGRTDADLELAIGPYERYVPLVVGPDPAATLAQVSERVRADLAATARFAVFAPAPVADAAFSRHEDDRVARSHGGFPLELVVSGTTATLWHDPRQVTAEHAERLAAQVHTLVSVAAAGAGTAAASLDIRGPEERAFLARVLGAEGVEQPWNSITDAFAAQVAARPDAPAVVHGEDALTYTQLDARAGGVAAALGTGTQPVAILLDRSADLVAAALGILRTGAAYLPLEPAHPRARLAEQLVSVGAATVVTSRAMAAGLPDSVRTIMIDEIQDTPSEAGPAGPDSVAYLIFTSGSTGIPKAVAVTHRNVLSYATGVSWRLGLDENTRFASVTGMSTDLGNTAVFGALLNGGTLEIISGDALSDGPRLGELVRAHRVTALKITPSHLRALLAGGDVTLPLRLLVTGGEPLDAELVARARAAGVDRIVNHYGPTETTIGVFTHEVAASETDPLPIGRPLPHVRAHVLDAAGIPVPVGVVGELGIGGPGVAAGYAGQAEATAQRFVGEPDHPGARMYLTGDLVRVRGDGAVEFVGRADGQVKIHGFRVELGEIEARLRRDDSVAQAAAVADGDVLTAYVVPAGGDLDLTAVRRRLAEQVPAHMVPAKLVQLTELPLTGSGKLDRQRLIGAGADEPEKASGREPASVAEKDLLALWRDVLALPDLGVDDNFFLVGGHSLLATKVIARSRAHFGVDIPLHVIFASPTVASMAAEIERRLPEADADLAELLSDLESISDDEAARLLQAEAPGATDDS